MERRRIGSFEVSVVGLGCNNFGRRLDAAASARVVHAALEAGIDFFDTADVYGEGRSEEYLGRALGSRRAEVRIATKFGKPMPGQGRGAHPDAIRTAVEASLRRLGTERIDLYQLHEPDPEVPIAESLGALDDLVRQGLVREIGCSNFSVEEMRAAHDAALARGVRPFASVQNEYSLLHREPEAGMLAECARTGTAFIPYFPLASGLLTGKYHRGEPPPEGSRLAGPQGESSRSEERLRITEELRAFSEARGHNLLELAISWLLARPVVASVIAGATRPEQVAANARSAQWRLSEADLAALDAILPGS